MYANHKPDSSRAVQLAVGLLGEFLQQTPLVRSELRAGSEPSQLDAVVEIQPYRFGLQYCSRASTAMLLKAIASLERAAAQDPELIPLLAVPFMGALGRQLCRDRGIAWLDLSGNADIQRGLLRILVSGQPNKYPSPGRPSTVFASKGSRLVRWLLMNPQAQLKQLEIAKASGLQQGYVSKLLSRMLESGYVHRLESGDYALQDARRLLRDWYQESRFMDNLIVAGSCYAVSGTALATQLTEQLGAAGLRHAFTGMAAAYCYRNFATYNLATVYVEQTPDATLLSKLGFHQDPRGANTWFVVPADAGVFSNMRLVSGNPCVHPVQLLIDLKEMPGRSREALADLLAMPELAMLGAMEEDFHVRP